MRAIRPYLVGIGLVGVFTCAKLALPPLGDDVPFVLYFGAPLVAALAGGRWPGVLTALTAAIAGNFFFLDRRMGLSTGLPALLQTGAFFIEAVAVVLICDALLQTRSHLLAQSEARLSDQSALAQHRAQLFASERDARAVAERERIRSERLYRLTTALASTMSTRSVAERVWQHAAETVGSDSVSLFVKDPAKDVLVLQSNRGDRRDVEGYETVDLQASVAIAAVARELRPRFFESLAEVVAEAALRGPLATSPFQAWALLPLASASGSVLGVVAFLFREPTRFDEDARQLATAVAEQCAVALDRARAYEAEAIALRKKDEFLAMLGHELRNPLAPIVTAINLIRMRGKASEREIGILERQAAHLVRLVDDLLDVSRITSGKLVLHKRPVEMAEVIDQALESTSKPFEDKRLKVDVKVARVGLTVHGDSERLVQIVTNLLGNAAKFTPADRTVTVSAARRENAVVVEVCDEGEGIAPDLLPHVFELFAQGRQTSERSSGGLGLGLAIAKSLAVAHDGTIVAESAGLDRGTTMTVTLPWVETPYEAAPDHTTKRASLHGAAKARILVVDDNEDGAEMLATYLDTLGYETCVANDASETLRLAGQKSLDVIVLDIGLPGMDGYEVASELRAQLGEATPPLIALTGYAQSSDRERALAGGFRAHFGKPVDMAQLEKVLDELLA